MNPFEELKEMKEKIEKLNREIKEAILGTGEYKNIPKEDRKEILAVLNSDKEWYKKRIENQEKKGETYIQKIQELLPNMKFSDSLHKLLKNNKHFYHRLNSCTDWKDAKAFIDEAKLFLKTRTKLQVSQTDGYRFGEVISYMGQGETLVQKAFDLKGNYCAKIGRLSSIQAEFEISKQVIGPFVMPVLKFIVLPDDRAAIITPLYGETVADWIFNLEEFADEDDIISILLCGISAIYSFASQGLAHCDIKLNNLMFESRAKSILIDFGSATKFGSFISATTPGIRFEYCSPSIRYDINSLSIAIARIILKKHEEFASKEHLFSMVMPLATKYPIVFKMLGLMRIDENLESAAELLNVWNNVYLVAKEKKPFVSDFPEYAPP